MTHLGFSRDKYESFLNYNFKNGHDRLAIKLEDLENVRPDIDRRPKLNNIGYENIEEPLDQSYKTIEARLQSFNERGPSLSIDNPEFIITLMAIAGYFYNNTTEKLTCFYCGIDADENYDMDVFLTLFVLHQNLQCGYGKQIWETLPLVLFKELNQLFTNDTADNSNYYSELERLRTLEHYKISGNGSVITGELREKYARAGFYWTAEGSLHCPFCNIKISQLKHGFNNPIRIHRLFNQSCPLMRLNEPRNIPIDDQLCQINILRRPYYRHYSTDEKRIESYKELVALNIPNIAHLEPITNVGFFYTNKKYQIKCFYCGLEANILDDLEDILNKHEEMKKYCPFYNKSASVTNRRSENIDYCSEERRLDSFRTYEITDEFKAQLAYTGLYLSGGTMQCNFCDFVMDPIDISTATQIKCHSRANPPCKLIRNNETRNIPITDDDQLRPVHKMYDSTVERLRTYTHLIVGKKLIESKASIMAMAGYFYSGIEKPELICFYCGISADIGNGDCQISEIHDKKDTFCRFAVNYLFTNTHFMSVITDSFNSSQLLRFEFVRLKSFDKINQINSELVFDTELKEKYARVGLYWTQNEKYVDEVKCYFCHFRLVALKRDDTDPVALHYRYNSSCPLLSDETKNIPINVRLFQQSILTNPRHPRKENILARLDSLIKINNISDRFVKILAIAGFFTYNDEYNDVTCFYCGVSISFKNEDIGILPVHFEQGYCPFNLQWMNWYKILLDKICNSQHNEAKCAEKYFSEVERFKSFNGFVSKYANVILSDDLKREYSRAGFYWTKLDGIIKCSFCNIKLVVTEVSTDPIVAHLRKNASCSLMRLYEPRNVPIDSNRSLIKSIIATSFYEHFRDPINRFESFKRLRLEGKVDHKLIDSLGIDGFFNINGTGQVVCIYCHFEADISEGRYAILRNHCKIKACENEKNRISRDTSAPNYFLESERQKSFESNTCLNTSLELREYHAIVGFYSTSSTTEEIKCIFCDKTHRSLTDDPVDLHYDSCCIKTLEESQNIPINDELFQKKVRQKPLHADYEKTEERFISFEQLMNDTNEVQQNDAVMLYEFLAVIGFFKCNDKIKCYFCGVDADINDDIVVIINQHQENYKCCPILMELHTFLDLLCDISLVLN